MLTGLIVNLVAMTNEHILVRSIVEKEDAESDLHKQVPRHPRDINMPRSAKKLDMQVHGPTLAYQRPRTCLAQTPVRLH